MTHKITWFAVERPTDVGGTTYVRPAPRRVGVWLCEWCEGVNDNDPERLKQPGAVAVLCPCEASTTTEREVAARHRTAVLRARRWGQQQEAA